MLQRMGLMIFLFLQVSTGRIHAAVMLPGFPIQLKGTIEVSGPIPIDLDQDGILELIIGTQSGLHAYTVSGSKVPGFPVEFDPGAKLITGLTAGPLEKGGPPVMLFGSEDGALNVFDHQGQPLMKVPSPNGSLLAGAPTLADLDQDGIFEIIYAKNDGTLHVIDRLGQPLKGYPVQTKHPLSTSVTIGRFRLEGPVVLFFGDDHGQLHAWSKPGEELPGFPYKAQFTISGQPILGDIDDDGVFEVMVGSKDYRIHAIREDGTQVEGFPVATGYRIYATGALGDLTKDGVNDLVMVSGDGKLYAFERSGKLVAGFPVKAGNRLRAPPVIGDLDADGFLEIVVGSDEGRLYVFRHTGKTYPGYPLRLDEQVLVSPLIADLDRDGVMEIFVVTRTGTLYGYRMLKKGKVAQPPVWPMEGQTGTRRGMSSSHPARYIKLQILPAQPRVSDELTADYHFFDLDGDPEPESLIQWYRNGKLQKDLHGQKRVPSHRGKKGERWKFSIQAGLQESAFTSPEVSIVNTPPTFPEIALEPQNPRTKDNLSLKILKPALDVDQDPVRYDIVWHKNGQPVFEKKDRVLSSNTNSGERWMVVVTPHDGQQAGPTAWATVIIENTPPSAPIIALQPKQPTISDELSVVLQTPSTDADQDPIRYHYQWFKAGSKLGLSESSSVLPVGFGKKHDQIQVGVTAWDGQEASEPVLASTTFINTLPASLEIAILPPNPTSADDLYLFIKQPAIDLDGDPVQYEISWWVDRKLTNEFSGYTVPALRTQRGQTWEVEVTPKDDSAKGKPVRTECRIQNQAPKPPFIRASNPFPFTDQDLELVIESPAWDHDGDAVSLEVGWYAHGKEIARGENLLRLPSRLTQKGMRYLARVTPHDGTTAGPSVEQGFEVKNSPPEACQIELTPKTPKTKDRLKATLSKPLADKDGDTVELLYRFYKNGKWIEGRDEKDNTVKGEQVAYNQIWTVIATPFDGEATGPFCQDSVQVINQPPLAPGLNITPFKPTVSEDLVVRITKPASDPDGQPITLLTVWKLNGEVFYTGPNLLQVPRQALRKGQNWELEVWAHDGELSSPKVSARASIVNSPPGIPEIVIEPAKPTSEDDLKCSLIRPSNDPDADELSYHYHWREEANPKNHSLSTSNETVLKASSTKRNQTWTCEAWAHDGEQEGPKVKTSVKIANAKPSSPKVRIEPLRPKSDQDLYCKIEKEAQDSDGDSLRYRYQWIKNANIHPVAAQTERIPARLTKPGDVWQCIVSAFDGKETGPSAKGPEVIIEGE